jgi:hypothetical protein
VHALQIVTHYAMEYQSIGSDLSMLYSVLHMSHLCLEVLKGPGHYNIECREQKDGNKYEKDSAPFTSVI